ncbi:efflux RND transporter periplasmic adaptor subunit [Lacisediminimonas sp.]|uniref:efflux RND transporter periplasmic adaptor subunit n=1 Tax=Lacisediminimonas sp. TaxID=3060582 RepID=UPI00271A3171|nr:efflux RND transporter periplasmic adaptor subunit [Lacisediminimonas sp.]MDO8300147.1 efflux RND transporter periplasmic adaptor subunit [Lacisediminimonas sp.]
MVQTRFRHAMRAFASILTTSLLLGACGKPAEKAEDVRPVRAMLLEPQKISVIAEFPGEVRARVESRLGFRVPGKIVTRNVDVGAAVKRGQVLMQLDPQDLRLAQAQADAALRAANSNLALAKSEFARYQELRQKNFVSAAVLQAKETAFQSAQASHEQALAAARNQSNQAGYANLLSDSDGVVTAIDAEAGQVVAAGTPVLRVARPGDKEVVIGIPEDKVDALRNIADLQVTFWADREYKMKGKLRELSPVADPATRTYLARVSIPDAAQQIRLGMTATVAFIAANPNPVLKLPLSALFNEKGNTAVWVVENGAVKLVPVQLATVSGNDVVIASGVAAGQTVVTAGVNLLKPGQKVKLLVAESPAAPAVTAGSPGSPGSRQTPNLPAAGTAGAAK